MANPEYSETDFLPGEDFDGAGTTGSSVSMAALGAVVSLALLGGVGWWAYDLAMRNVHGVPVIAALEGPARVAPETPGGFQAANQGLSVTAVSSREETPTPDAVTLAPPPADLLPEDQPIGELEPAARDAILREAVDQAVRDANATGPVPVTPASVTSPPPPVETAAASVPRPQPRPVFASVARAAPAALTRDLPETVELDPADIPSGTRLVQLGAYDSATTARAQWDLIAARFDPYFAGRQRVIERADVSGRTFYRLRVHGFKNRSEADRFCAALKAQRTDCIPALAR